MNRYRNWMITDFCHFTPHYQNICQSYPELISALIGQIEVCPETQKEHFQAYVEFQKAIHLKTVKKLLGCEAVHLEIRAGSQAQAVAYCKKIESRQLDCLPFIYGEFKEQGKRSDLHKIVEEVLKKKSTKDIILENPNALKYITHIEKLSYLINDCKRNWITEVNVLIGEPGSGKTRYVHEKEEDLYVIVEPTSTIWFDGYKGQEAVLFDDFNGNIRYNLMLQLLDRYPMTVNTKGGTTNWCPKRIYITSNNQISEWYPNVDTTALRRRVTKCIGTEVYGTEVAGNTIPPPIEHS